MRIDIPFSHPNEEIEGHYLASFTPHLVPDRDLLMRYLPPEMFVYFCQKSGLSPIETLNRIAEMLKFLILVRDFPGNIIFGKEIDDIWHLWVLQTREYEILCASLPGGEIRHHSAREYPETPEALSEMMVKVLGIDAPSTREPAHTPSPTKEEDEKARSRFEMSAQRILSFFASYYSNFGAIRAENIGFWPPLNRMMERLGWDVQKLNAFLDEQVTKAKINAA